MKLGWASWSSWWLQPNWRERDVNCEAQLATEIAWRQGQSRRLFEFAKNLIGSKISELCSRLKYEFGIFVTDHPAAAGALGSALTQDWLALMVQRRNSQSDRWSSLIKIYTVDWLQPENVHCTQVWVQRILLSVGIGLSSDRWLGSTIAMTKLMTRMMTIIMMTMITMMMILIVAVVSIWPFPLPPAGLCRHAKPHLLHFLQFVQYTLLLLCSILHSVFLTLIHFAQSTFIALYFANCNPCTVHFTL